MEVNRMPNRQLWMWILGAQSALLVVGAGSVSWLTVLLAGAAGLGLSCCVLRISRNVVCQNRLFWILEWLWTVVMIGLILGQTRDCWQTGEGGSLLIPVTLLLLAISAGWQGGTQPARVGSVLTWLLGIIYIVVSASGIRGIHLDRIETTVEFPNVMLALGFLLPCAAVLLPGKADPGKSGYYYLGAMGLALAVSFLTMGTLSESAAQNENNAFYEAVRGLSLFGTAERFESFLSAAMTIGWYSALSLMTVILGEASQHISGKRGCGIVTGSITALILFILDVPWGMGIITGGTVAAWCILPMLASVKKKVKKQEKTLDKRGKGW